MRRVITISLLALAILLSPAVANAQLKRLLKEKALEAVKGLKTEEEQTTTEEVKEQPQPEKPKPAGPNFLERRMMQAMGLNNVKFDPSYSFTSSMVMDIETIDSLKNRDKMQYTTYFNNNNKSYAMIFDSVDKESGKKQKGTMIFDMVNNAMLILSEENGERTGVAIAIPPDSTATAQAETTEVENASDNFIHPYYKPTGRTKTIAGHSCKEYAYEDTHGKVSFWTTRESKLNLSQAYGQVYGLQALATAGLGYGMGMVMEMETEDFVSGAKTIMRVNEMQDNSPKRLDVSTYQIVGMGGQ
ncbi:MAG: hypothetical protein RBT74_14025 [Tenuifilaceae bacterium]|jgi:hypothetical protein|nr:hypothetical protein [Tenuifilaceae bacterium]